MLVTSFTKLALVTIDSTDLSEDFSIFASAFSHQQEPQNSLRMEVRLFLLCSILFGSISFVVHAQTVGFEVAQPTGFTVVRILVLHPLQYYELSHYSLSS